MQVPVLFLSNKQFIFLFLLVSFALHLAVIFWCSFYIEAKSSPSVYVWPNILARKDLFFEKKPVQFPPESFSASSAAVRRDYFSTPVLKEGYRQSDFNQDSKVLQYSRKLSANKSYLREKKLNHLYLWERQSAWSSGKGEVIPYRVYVSKQGKVIFLYPEKLSIDSYQSLNFQDYIKESSFFLEDKFFWTKLEGVVQ